MPRHSAVEGTPPQDDFPKMDAQTYMALRQALEDRSELTPWGKGPYKSGRPLYFGKEDDTSELKLALAKVFLADQLPSSILAKI